MSLNADNAILSNAIKVDSSYNVGIGGAASGSYKLQVTGTTNITGALTGTSGTFTGLLSVNNAGEILRLTGADSYIAFRNASNVQIGDIGYDGRDTDGLSIWNNNASGSLVFGAGAARAMTITSGGGFGIGTTDMPYGKVSIKSNTATSYGGLNVFANGNNNFIALNHTGSAGIIETEFSTGGSHTPLQFVTGGSTRLTISTSGVATFASADFPAFNSNANFSFTGGNYDVWNFLAPNQTGGALSFNIGKSLSTYNNAALKFHYLGNNSSSNFLGIGFYDNDNILNIKAGGYVGIGFTGYSTTRLLVRGADNATNYGFIVENLASYELFSVRNDGLVNTGTRANSPYNNTTGSAANAIFASDGTLQRSTSSLKYKKNVQDYTKGLAEVMQLRPVIYESKNERESGIQYAGLIAEEIHDLGLTEFVQYAEDGTPDALAYQNMVALLVKAIQQQQQQINSLINR